MNFIYQYDLHFVLRLLVACVCGVLIGIERKNRAKEAGVRTHCLVACAAALMMILSKYAYDDLTGELIKLDPSRVASGVASGVGSLRAGMIFVYKRTISGLTTAAGIWATAGIGLAIGAGMYILGLASTIIVLLVQILLHVNARWLRRPKIKRLDLFCGDEPEMQQYANGVFHELGIAVSDLSIKKDASAGRMEYRFYLEIPAEVEESDLLARFSCDCNLIMNE